MNMQISIDGGSIISKDNITNVKVGDLVVKCVSDDYDVHHTYDILVADDNIISEIVRENNVLVSYYIVDRVHLYANR